ncbi:MAG: hypothetical protein KAR20_11045 [Candidatus Heimdallarchaeota archaeon]|nr:hypothetical protein [Candidatus Heimdallarchaeota archaeon]
MKNLIMVVLLVIAGLGTFGFSLHHTWYQNTPERLSDPVNWVVMVVLGILYFLGFWFFFKEKK